MYIFRESEFSCVLHLSLRSICIFRQLPPDVSRFLATGQLTLLVSTHTSSGFPPAATATAASAAATASALLPPSPPPLSTAPPPSSSSTAAVRSLCHRRCQLPLSLLPPCRPAALDQEARAVVVIVVVDAGRPSSSRRGRGRG